MGRQGVGKNVRVRLYMEGRLIANGGVGVNVSGNEGAPLTFQVQLTPTNAIKHVLPGTWVHIFCDDPFALSPAGDLSDFKLLCEGVVIGRGFTRETAGRAFVIDCAGPEIFWVEARQFWLNLTSAGGGIVEQVAVQTSMGAGRFGTVTSTGTYGYMVSKMSQIQEDQQERFLDTLLAVIDQIGNVNPYYTNNRNRFRITDRIVRAHCGKVEKLFQLSLLSDFLTGLSSRVSGQTNLAEVVNMLLEPILHGWVSVPAPSYVQSRIFMRDIFGNVIQKPNTAAIPQSGGSQTKLFSYEMGTEKILAGTIFKPDVYTLSPPTCNILLPDMYEHLGFQENFLQEPTRLIMRPNLIGTDLSAISSLGFQFMRPNELEIFTQLTRDLKKGITPGQVKKRDPDGSFADGEGQTPTYNDYDWGTNEERIRGIVYQFINLAPAPATLTLSDQGKKQPDGTRTGGMPKYLQNVASYEWYKAKFAARVTTVSGVFNIRPVPGFPMLLVDDSAAKMNIICKLKSIQHSINAEGHASTSYTVELPRLVDEIDFNRPNFTGGTDPKSGQAILDQAKDADGNFSFDKLFSGQNRPPIPEWFSDDYRTLVGLDNTYQQFFGSNTRVLESVLFAPGKDNESISQLDAVNELIARYQRARASGKEFEESAQLTQRDMATIDQAFLFVGAAPNEYANTPANQRKIDYKTAKLDLFVGDISPGAGYNAQPEGSNPSTTKNANVDAISGAGARSGAPKTPQMSGAFPQFDATIHTGKDATDKATRAQVQKDESKPSAFARYDGRPTMYDFEFRLWGESKAAATAAFASDAAQAARDAAGKFASAPGGGVVAISAAAAAANAAATVAAKQQKTADQRTTQQTLSSTPAQQAPTGDSVDGGGQLPLPQPLSERQIVDLRRAVVEQYRKELEGARGFTG